MASRAALPSDPEFLIDFMHDLPVDSDSDDEFDGYLEPEDGPVVFRSAAELDDEAYTLRSQSLQDLTELEEAGLARVAAFGTEPLPLSDARAARERFSASWRQPHPALHCCKQQLHPHSSGS